MSLMDRVGACLEEEEEEEGGGLDTRGLAVVGCMQMRGKRVVGEKTVEEEEVTAEVSVFSLTTGATLKGIHETSSLPGKRNNGVKSGRSTNQNIVYH